MFADFVTMMLRGSQTKTKMVNHIQRQHEDLLSRPTGLKHMTEMLESHNYMSLRRPMT